MGDGENFFGVFGGDAMSQYHETIQSLYRLKEQREQAAKSNIHRMKGRVVRIERPKTHPWKSGLAKFCERNPVA